MYSTGTSNSLYSRFHHVLCKLVLVHYNYLVHAHVAQCAAKESCNNLYLTKIYISQKLKYI